MISPGLYCLDDLRTCLIIATFDVSGRELSRGEKLVNVEAGNLRWRAFREIDDVHGDVDSVVCDVRALDRVAVQACLPSQARSGWFSHTHSLS
jgi:hypothetical protein